MQRPAGKLSLFERFLGLFTVTRPGEGRAVALFFLLAFLILVAYYVLKTLREPLLLVDDPAGALEHYLACFARDPAAVDCREQATALALAAGLL